MSENIFFAYAAWNFIVFLTYGLDKGFARRGTRRISERTLLMLAFFMGAAGAAFGMYVFHHKTRKKKFRILIPVYLILNIAAVYASDIGGILRNLSLDIDF